MTAAAMTSSASELRTAILGASSRVSDLAGGRRPRSCLKTEVGTKASMDPMVCLLAVRSALISPRRLFEVRAPFPARRYNRRVDVRQWCRALTSDISATAAAKNTAR